MHGDTLLPYILKRQGVSLGPVRKYICGVRVLLLAVYGRVSIAKSLL